MKKDIYQKINNAKEHLLIVDEDLNKNLQKLHEVTEKITAAENTVKKLGEENVQLSAEIEKKKEYLSTCEDKLIAREHLVSLREQKVQQSEDDYLKNLRFKELELERHIKALEYKAGSMETILVNLSGSVERQEKASGERIKTIQSDEQKARETYNLLLVEVVEQDKIYRYKKSQIKSIEEELAGLRKTLAEQIVANETNLQNIKERERHVAIKEHDHRIITERLKRIHREFYPDRELKL